MPDYPGVLVDGRTLDDAGVMLLGSGQALVFTTDFFAPVVDDPADYGRIAAANALSDVYAMGGRPLCALNILGFPKGKVPADVIREIVRGGLEKCVEAGAALLGGHSIRNPEPVYGLAVIGLIDPGRILKNANALPDCDVVLTKPIGSGIITTAAMRDMATTEEVADAVMWMSRLNENAAKCALAADACAATDITGYGLVGHLSEIAEASGVTIELDAAAVPLMNGARRLIEERAIPGGTTANYAAFSGTVDFPAEMGELDRLLLCDAQTSGGLAICVQPEHTAALLAQLRQGGDVLAAVIGRTVEPMGKHIVVK